MTKRLSMGKGDKRLAKADTDNTSRRTWNKDEYRQQAADREKQVTALLGLWLMLLMTLT